MKASKFVRQILWRLVIFFVGEDESQKTTIKEALLGLSGIIFPIGGFGVSYICECSLKECFFWTFVGFLLAIFVLAIGIWGMEKKEKLYRRFRAPTKEAVMGWVVLLAVIIIVWRLSLRRCEKCGGVMENITREIDPWYWYRCKKCGHLTTG